MRSRHLMAVFYSLCSMTCMMNVTHLALIVSFSHKMRAIRVHWNLVNSSSGWAQFWINRFSQSFFVFSGTPKKNAWYNIRPAILYCCVIAVFYWRCFQIWLMYTYKCTGTMLLCWNKLKFQREGRNNEVLVN